MRHAIVVLWFLMSSSVIQAQPYTYDLPIKEHMFENGLRLLVLEQSGSHRVSCKIFFDMGALNEIPGELGSAHFLEHLMFKGTHTLGTTDWKTEQPLIESLFSTEAALIQELNSARNDLRERGVFEDYRHKTSNPKIDSLNQKIAFIDQEISSFRDRGAMMRWYQSFGGTRLTASTEQEYMKFDINLPANRVELFLRIEADRMKNSVFREFDQERMILVEQRYGDLRRATTSYFEALNGVVSDIHPVYWPEGFLSDFNVYTRHYERALYEEYFVVNNATLVFIGGVNLESMIPKVEKYFGWMAPAPEPTRVKAIEPPPQAERRMIWRSTTIAPRVDIRYKIPGIGHPDRPVFDVLTEVASSQLRKALQAADIEGRASVNTRVVHTSRFGVPSSLNFEVVVSREEDLAAAEQTIYRVLNTLEENPVPDDQLETAEKRLRAGWFRTLSNPDRLAFEIGHFQMMDRWQTLREHLKARDMTTGIDVQRVARRYFIPENRTVGLVRSPEKDGKKREAL